jgi:hypothetical protein
MENIRMCYATRRGSCLFRWRLTDADTTRIMSANGRPPISTKKSKDFLYRIQDGSWLLLPCGFTTFSTPSRGRRLHGVCLSTVRVLPKALYGIEYSRW